MSEHESYEIETSTWAAPEKLETAADVAEFLGVLGRWARAAEALVWERPGTADEPAAPTGDALVQNIVADLSIGVEAAEAALRGTKVAIEEKIGRDAAEPLLAAARRLAEQADVVEVLVAAAARALGHSSLPEEVRAPAGPACNAGRDEARGGGGEETTVEVRLLPLAERLTREEAGQWLLSWAPAYLGFIEACIWNGWAFAEEDPEARNSQALRRLMRDIGRTVRACTRATTEHHTLRVMREAPGRLLAARQIAHLLEIYDGGDRDLDRARGPEADADDARGELARHLAELLDDAARSELTPEAAA